MAHMAGLGRSVSEIAQTDDVMAEPPHGWRLAAGFKSTTEPAREPRSPPVSFHYPRSAQTDRISAVAECRTQNRPEYSAHTILIPRQTNCHYHSQPGPKWRSNIIMIDYQFRSPDQPARYKYPRSSGSSGDANPLPSRDSGTGLVPRLAGKSFTHLSTKGPSIPSISDCILPDHPDREAQRHRGTRRGTEGTDSRRPSLQQSDTGAGAAQHISGSSASNKLGQP